MKKLTSTQVYFAMYALMLFVTPLLVTTTTEEGFEFPKMFFIYFIGITTQAYYIAKKIYETTSIEITPKKTNIPIASYVLIFITATVFSEHLYTSLFGYYSRFNGGLISLLVFVGLFYIAKDKFNKSTMEKLFTLSTFTIMPISIFAIYQYIVFPNIERVYSTFGQPNWLAAYLATLLPFLLYKVLVAKQSTKSQVVYSLIFILGYLSLWLTFSISGLVGLVVGLGISMLLNSKELKQNKQSVLLITSICLIISIMLPGLFKDKIKDIFIDLRRVHAQTENLQNNISDTGFIRLQIWKGTLALVTANPKNFLIGTGPQTFSYTFQPFRPEELNHSSEWDYILNKPHNYFLEVLAETGLIGLISYMYILIYIFRKRSKEYTPCILALCVTNLFGWPTVYTSLLFWMLVAGSEISDTKI